MKVGTVKPSLRMIRALLRTVFGFGALVFCLFLLLVTRLGLHWWRPAWGTVTNRTLLTLLFDLSLVYCLLFGLMAGLGMRSLRRIGYQKKTVQRLLVSVEEVVLFALFAAWGKIVSTGQPALFPLQMIVAVLAIWSLAYAALHVYELRHKGTPLDYGSVP